MAKARQDLDDKVTCPVCLEHFEDPRHLSPCNHTVCLRCYTRMLNATPEGVKCPLGCTGTCTKRPDELAKNRTMMDLLEQAGQTHLLALSRPLGAKCQREECTRQSHGRCHHCDADLCSRHLLEDAYYFGNTCETLCSSARRLTGEMQAGVLAERLRALDGQRGRLAELQATCRELLTIARSAEETIEARVKATLAATQSEAERDREVRQLAEQLECETADQNTAQMRCLADRLRPLVDKLRHRRLSEGEVRTSVAPVDALERVSAACADLKQLLVPLASRLRSQSQSVDVVDGGGGGVSSVQWRPRKIFHYRSVDVAVVDHRGLELVCRLGQPGQLRLLPSGAAAEAGWEPLQSPVLYLLAQGGSSIKVLSCTGRSQTSLRLDVDTCSLSCIIYLPRSQTLALADTNQVFIADLTGRVLQAIAGFGRPVGLCADAERLFVADADKRSVAVFSLDTHVHQMNIVATLLVQSLDSICLLNERLFLADRTSGQIVAVDPGTGLKQHDFTADSPVRLTADASGGLLYICSGASGRVTAVSPDEGSSVASVGGRGRLAGEFRDPGGMAVCAGCCELVVCDRGNGRVQVFSLL